MDFNAIKKQKERHREAWQEADKTDTSQDTRPINTETNITETEIIKENTESLQPGGAS